MMTPPLAIPAATIAFCSGVSWMNSWPIAVYAWSACAFEGNGSVPLGPMPSVDAITPPVGCWLNARQIDGRDRVDAERLGLLAQDGRGLLHAELAVAGVARFGQHDHHGPATGIGVGSGRLPSLQSSLFESEKFWQGWTG